MRKNDGVPFLAQPIDFGAQINARQRLAQHVQSCVHDLLSLTCYLGANDASVPAIELSAHGSSRHSLFRSFTLPRSRSALRCAWTDGQPTHVKAGSTPTNHHP